MTEQLATCILDHLEESAIALNRLDRLEKAHAGAELAKICGALRGRIRADQRVLETLANRLENIFCAR